MIYIWNIYVGNECLRGGGARQSGPHPACPPTITCQSPASQTDNMTLSPFSPTNPHFSQIDNIYFTIIYYDFYLTYDFYS